ncbi:DsbA family protein [Blastococcus tunisiensis]|uniref:Protein-disulfide isomerase n=1 Tax=Blastococcus tunisiensis TaxID=1798228 RepID=A0A1I2JGL2_9ACTN|nr:thioredoxin domain-containing protein [Blastococcus sp. DSM 46838]SFF53982.1 Protein-disulfide isomerase [Blastococcus sp. DSM 46838]
MPASPSQQSRRASARQRIENRRAAEAAARAAAERRRRTVIGGVVAGVVLVVALVVVIVVQMQRTATSDAAAVPADTAADGTVVEVGADDGAVPVDIWADFQCPACQRFHQVNGETLEQLADEGTLQLRYHPIAILDRYSTDAYSTRSLNAAGVVVDAAGPEAFAEFTDLLYANQPPEGGAGLSDDELIELAAQAGATGDEVEAGIRDLVFEDWTARITEEASRQGVTSTPTVLVDGEPLDLRQATPATITALVEAAAPE